jgi:hypothetical protein
VLARYPLESSHLLALQAAGADFGAAAKRYYGEIQQRLESKEILGQKHGEPCQDVKVLLMRE